jgi:hypothetical protein
MGRYYNGDISGKFWFAVQSSDAADRFGVTGQTPNYLEYYFEEDDLADVQEELERIREILGEHLPKLEQFFSERNGYTDEELAAYLEVDYVTAKYLLMQYADLELGLKIEKELLETGSCEFQAEL